jgi:glyoxylase-like metal-dependent hydrolase (beta-lactamase superfamily II)
MFDLKTLEIYSFSVGLLKTNCFFVIDKSTRHTIIVDAGDEASKLKKIIKKYNFFPKYIISSHGHFDHNMAVYVLKKSFKIPFIASKKDYFLIKSIKESDKYNSMENSSVPTIDIDIEQIKEIMLADNIFEIIKTPGHTPGSICLYNKENSIIFSGDLIFEAGSRGRTDFSYSSTPEILNSIKKIMTLPPKTLLFCGHGKNTSIYKAAKYIYV